MNMLGELVLTAEPICIICSKIGSAWIYHMLGDAFKAATRRGPIRTESNDTTNKPRILTAISTFKSKYAQSPAPRHVLKVAYLVMMFYELVKILVICAAVNALSAWVYCVKYQQSLEEVLIYPHARRLAMAALFTNLLVSMAFLYRKLCVRNDKEAHNTGTIYFPIRPSIAKKHKCPPDPCPSISEVKRDADPDAFSHKPTFKGDQDENKADDSQLVWKMQALNEAFKSARNFDAVMPEVPLGVYIQQSKGKGWVVQERLKKVVNLENKRRDVILTQKQIECLNRIQGRSNRKGPAEKINGPFFKDLESKGGKRKEKAPPTNEKFPKVGPEKISQLKPTDAPIPAEMVDERKEKSTAGINTRTTFSNLEESTEKTVVKEKQPSIRLHAKGSEVVVSAGSSVGTLSTSVFDAFHVMPMKPEKRTKPPYFFIVVVLATLSVMIACGVYAFYEGFKESSSN